MTTINILVCVLQNYFLHMNQHINIWKHAILNLFRWIINTRVQSAAEWCCLLSSHSNLSFTPGSICLLLYPNLPYFSPETLWSSTSFLKSLVIFQTTEISVSSELSEIFVRANHWVLNKQGRWGRCTNKRTDKKFSSKRKTSEQNIIEECVTNPYHIILMPFLSNRA